MYKKAFLLVIIVFLVAAGCNKSNNGTGDQNTPQPAPIDNANSSATDFKTYTDPNFGFSFDYPKDLNFEDPDKTTVAEQTYFPTAAWATLGSMVIPKDNYPGTNFSSAFATVAVNKAATVDLCKQWGMNGDSQPVKAGEEKVLPGAVTINGTTFYTGTTGDAAAGTYGEIRMYHAFNKELCYEISLTILRTQLANYPEGTVTEVNADTVWSRLSTVLNTFKFN